MTKWHFTFHPILLLLIIIIIIINIIIIIFTISIISKNINPRYYLHFLQETRQDLTKWKDPWSPFYLILTRKLLTRKTFSKFYRRHYELISKYNVGLKTLLSEGLSEPEFYGDLVYKFKKLIGSNDFSFQFRKIITRYKRIGYNLNVMRQSACLVFNPITVDNYAAFFNCTPVGRASDSMMAPT